MMRTPSPFPVEHVIIFSPGSYYQPVWAGRPVYDVIANIIKSYTFSTIECILSQNKGKKYLIISKAEKTSFFIFSKCTKQFTINV